MTYARLNIKKYSPYILIDNQNIQAKVPPCLEAQGALMLLKNGTSRVSEINDFIRALNTYRADAFSFFTSYALTEEMFKIKRGSAQVAFEFTIMRGQNNPYINNIPTLALAKKIALQTRSKIDINFSARIVITRYYYENNRNSVTQEHFKTIMFNFQTKKWCPGKCESSIIEDYSKTSKLLSA